MLQFRSRTRYFFGFDNGDISDLVVDPTKTEQKLVDRDLVPEMLDIRLESNYQDFEEANPSGVQPGQDYVAIAAVTRACLGLDDNGDMCVKYEGVDSEPVDETVDVKSDVDLDISDDENDSEPVGDDDESSDDDDDDDPPNLQIRDDSDSDSSGDKSDNKDEPAEELLGSEHRVRARTGPILTCSSFKGHTQCHEEGVLQPKIAHVRVQCPATAGISQSALRAVVEGHVLSGGAHVSFEKGNVPPRAMTEEKTDYHVVGVILAQQPIPEKGLKLFGVDGEKAVEKEVS